MTPRQMVDELIRLYSEGYGNDTLTYVLGEYLDSHGEVQKQVIAYNNYLNNNEIVPTGDDYNNLLSLVLYDPP